ncbi:hypothetical protein FIV42_08530 [Persicimonas caeni]|uniref:Uncharacterized protein n=1 Tax=Persicimonas caeni TaxID=2292766 RepID=A0A4Y6PSM9_PERCE|nr:hypothetical protein [Persicimonas caeni]QDG50775.1 hypothetical protein FIV42_08530 [Persicimonas caeni]QED31996.1 hypothetical protein FRD00_08525 [Persicimonas caeni]
MNLFEFDRSRARALRRMGWLLACATTWGAVGCDKEQEARSRQTAAETADVQAAGVAVTLKPCRLEVDSPADGEVDGTFDVAYEGKLPRKVEAKFGEGDELTNCISLGYTDGRLVSKGVREGVCSAKTEPSETSQLRAVDGSNLVALTFPDGELTYHYVTAPGDFSFLVTRTGYNLGPQPIDDVKVVDGRLVSLTLPAGQGEHKLEADYRAGKLIRVSERHADGEEVGYASFHYREDRLLKVERKLATMDAGQTEVVRLSYECTEDAEGTKN